MLDEIQILEIFLFTLIIHRCNNYPEDEASKPLFQIKNAPLSLAFQLLGRTARYLIVIYLFCFRPIPVIHIFVSGMQRTAAGSIQSIASRVVILGNQKCIMQGMFFCISNCHIDQGFGDVTAFIGFQNKYVIDKQHILS